MVVATKLQKDVQNKTAVWFYALALSTLQHRKGSHLKKNAGGRHLTPQADCRVNQLFLTLLRDKNRSRTIYIQMQLPRTVALLGIRMLVIPVPRYAVGR
jgi:hypothetical protein